jgi:HD-GYP domain-containing protein (c-di-GMP phosphodiesterase class II)
MAVEKYSLRELEKLIAGGKKFRLFKPFMYNGQILLNVEKILTERDVFKMDGKVYGEIEVVTTVETKVDDKLRTAIIGNAVKILKTAPLFHVDEVHHLDFKVRKQVEKLLYGIIGGNNVLAHKLYEIYQWSKKLFIHSINVGIIASVIDLGMQQKRKQYDALRSEELLTAALMHDVGFLKLPQELLEKKRFEYNEKEKTIYQTYPTLGADIAEDLSHSFRNNTITVILQHQERLHGQGFPNKMKNGINEMALIVGLADEFDLLLSKELAMHQRSASEIMSRISRSAKYFGHDIVDSFYTWFRYLK